MAKHTIKTKRGPSVRPITSKIKPKRQNSYLEYLDKEMTIMGILSTFSITSAALFLNAVGSAEPSKQTLFLPLWAKEHWYILAGSAWMVAAAGLFYDQRSTLAWYYGQLTLAIEAPKKINSLDPVQWMQDADCWTAWLPYSLACWSLALGFIAYAFAILELATHQRLPWFAVAASVVVILAATSDAYIFRNFPYEDEPRKAFLKRIRCGCGWDVASDS
jgi:hypothetical protein